jgi:methyl-accepting chemotaxis protein
MLYQMAAGDVDLSRRLDVKSKDEIGRISSNFNRLVDKLAAIIRNLKTVAEKGSVIGNELASSSEELSATVEEIARAIDAMSEKVATQSDEMKRANVDVREIKDALGRLNALIDEQAGTVTESSASSSHRRVHQNSPASRSSERGLRNSRPSRRGERGMESTGDGIAEIAGPRKPSSSLGAMIDQIAPRRTLLAMKRPSRAATRGGGGRASPSSRREPQAAETRWENSKDISDSLATIVRRSRCTRLTIDIGCRDRDIIAGSRRSGG